MNSSKLYEWLLDNDCPWEFEPVTTGDVNSTTIEFTEKEDESDDYDKEFYAQQLRDEAANHFDQCPQSTKNMYV